MKENNTGKLAGNNVKGGKSCEGQHRPVVSLSVCLCLAKTNRKS